MYNFVITFPDIFFRFFELFSILQPQSPARPIFLSSSKHLPLSYLLFSPATHAKKSFV